MQWTKGKALDVALKQEKLDAARGIMLDMLKDSQHDASGMYWYACFLLIYSELEVLKKCAVTESRPKPEFDQEAYDYCVEAGNNFFADLKLGK